MLSPFIFMDFFNKQIKQQLMKRTILNLLLLTVAMAASAQTQYKTLTDISYTDAGETAPYRKERCKLDVYFPQGKKGFKTLVWFHGGGLEGGQKEIRDELKDAGFAIVAPNYRLFPKAQCPDYIVDAAQAVAWTVAHIAEYGGDPSQVYVGGHSAGGYLTLMLALDKSYLARFGVDADSIRAYYPVSGQCATHYTIRKERKIPFELPIVDQFAPLNNARKLNTRLVLFTGERRLEMMARYEENLYLKSILEGIGNQPVTIHELSGFDHGTVLGPACLLIRQDMGR